MKVEEKAFRDKIDRVELEELMYDEFYELIAEAKKIGYAKAMRWRDPKVELPESQEIVLVKSDNGCYATAYCHGASGCFIDYGSDAYVDFGEIIGWRPIE